MVCITFLTALLQGQKLSIYPEPWMKLGYMACITFLNVLLYILKLSIYPDSRTMIKVDMKHSKCTCELVLLQANINRTWNLDRWHVLHFSLPYFRYSSCPSTQILGSWSKLIKLSIYPYSRNLTQVYLKHSKYSCELVLLQANINSTWNLNKWCVLYFSLPYSRDKSCPSTQNLGWNLDRWRVLYFSLSYFRYSSCPSTLILETWSKLIWNTPNAPVSLCYYK